MPPPSLSLVREPSESTGEHLLSPFFAGAGNPTPIPKGQDPLPCAQPRTPFHEPEMLSTNESHLLARAFARGLSWAATSSLTLPSSTWLPTCFHASSQEALDPTAFRYSLGPIRAACCPSVSATECPASTPATTPIFNGRAANRLPTKRRPSFEGLRPSLLRSGVAGLFEHVDPRLSDRSPRRIYPGLTNSSTPCRASVSFPVWKTSRNDDPAVLDPLRTKAPGLPGRSRHPR